MVKLNDQDVGTNGFGLMGFTWRPNPTPHDKAIPVMKTALNRGASFFNGGEFYGTPENNSLQLLNAYFTEYPEDADKVIISIKGGVDPKTLQPQGDEAGVRRSVDNCIKLLDGKKKLDLFECARKDPNVEIEETIKVLAALVEEGKLGGISLSEVGEQTIRRAAKVHKIAVVEVEFSMFCTEILHNGVAKACAELGIPIAAYSPLGRGFLTGQIKSIEDLDKLPPMIKHFPRFTPGNFEKNMELVHATAKVAEKKGCSQGQIALAWVKHHSGKEGMPEIIPIPGSTTEERVKENTEEVTISEQEFEELNEIIKSIEVVGGRYPEHMSHLNFS